MKPSCPLKVRFPMHVISFSNPKGGTGKSTTALLVAEQLALAGKAVALIDNDPSQNLMHWQSDREGRGLPTAFKVFPKSDPDNFDTLITNLDKTYDFAIVDMEGVKDLMASVVTMSSDLVVIPMQASPMDARNAASQLSIIKLASRHLKRPIPHVFVFTRTNATIVTRLYRAIKEEMDRLPILGVNLVERAAFKHMHEDGSLLTELDPKIVSGLANASQNALELTQAILDFMKGRGGDE
jgi:chromosome partitioning protein